MGTHGRKFKPRERLFSIGKKQEKPWMVDFYDDAILEFDQYVAIIINHLEVTNKLKNTIVVIHSDHGMKWESGVRIPLIIYFPDQSHVGRVTINAQLLDIAPTILDYMGIEAPEWMRGESLLTSGIDKLRPIIMTSIANPKTFVKKGWTVAVKADSSPPFYGLYYISAVICHKLYRLNLKDNTFSVSEIVGHTSPCDDSSIPDNTEARRYIINHLSENGYDVSSIRTP